MILIDENLSTILRRLWRFLKELPFLVSYDKRSVQTRSIVRIIGTILPLPPAPRVYFNLAAWNPELIRFTDDSGCEIFTQKSHERVNYQKQINELHDELRLIKDKLAILLEKESAISKLEKITITGRIPPCPSMPPPIPPPPPPPPPMPDLNLTAKPPRLVITKRNSRYGHQNNCDALHLVLSQLAKEKPKLRHVERSPGGRPIKPKREAEMDPNDILAQVLKKRYSVIQESSDAESFNASFTEITSPIKSAAG